MLAPPGTSPREAGDGVQLGNAKEGKDKASIQLGETGNQSEGDIGWRAAG